MDEETMKSPASIGFKKRKVKVHNVRRNKQSEEDEDPVESGEEIISILEETKEKQRLREKQKGISIAELAIGKKITVEEEVTSKDVFNVKTGGMVNMQALKSGQFKQTASDDPYDTGIGTQFSAETNKRDEDEEMMKYIEEQLKAKEGENNPSTTEDDARKYMSPEEAALYSIPEHLRQSSTHRSEEMLSNQMLSGIPEIDLGIDAKIKNIEATEEAKQKLLQDQKNRKDAPSHFVPTNVAVNFVQHNRFNVDDQSRKRRQNDSNNQKRPEHKKKSTDDYHYDKFRKQFRKH